MTKLRDISDWLHRASETALSPDLVEVAAQQLGVIAAALALAMGIRLATGGFTDRLFGRAARSVPTGLRLSGLRGVVTLAYGWLLLVIAERALARFGHDATLVGVAATLTALWIILRAATVLLRDALFARLVATIAVIVAALDIFGLLQPTAAVLDSIALTIGAMRLSLLLVVKAVLIIAILLWAALAFARLVSVRLQRLAGLSPSVQALAGNLLKIVLVTLALVIGLNTVGIDLTALAVFSGAVGVGIGLGLQKIVSNFISGIILLLEQSIKPSDVNRGRAHLWHRHLARRPLHGGARPRRQGISDPERDADHQPGHQLVLFDAAVATRHQFRGRVWQRSARGAAARDRGDGADPPRPRLAGTGLSHHRIRR